MKTFICAMIFGFSTMAFAADKTCTFAYGYDDRKGEEFTASVDKSEVKVNEPKGDYDGKYPKSKAPDVKGKDKKTYLNYDMQGSDGCDTVLADEELLQEGGVGYIKFVCRGEGYDQEVFFCHDDKK